MALKLGRDEVWWAWSPCYPGREGWNAGAWGGQENTPRRYEVSRTEETKLYGFVCSDNSTERVNIVDCQMRGGGEGGIGIPLEAGREGRGQI